MGRELQKKKNRSSIPKVKHKPKSKRLNIRSNPIVAANWDQNLTLSQNYRRLGLTSKLNVRSGGIEKLASEVDETANNNNNKSPGYPKDALSAVPKLPTTLTPTETRIERDPTTGAIIRVIPSPSANRNPLNDPLNDVSDAEDAGDAPVTHAGRIVRELEAQASMEIKKRPRQQSKREEEWISDLVEKYGEEYGRMARDRKLNPYQQSEGDLRKRVRTWKERRKS